MIPGAWHRTGVELHPTVGSHSREDPQACAQPFFGQILAFSTPQLHVSTSRLTTFTKTPRRLSRTSCSQTSTLRPPFLGYLGGGPSSTNSYQLSARGLTSAQLNSPILSSHRASSPQAAAQTGGSR